MSFILALIFGLARTAHGGGYVGRVLSVLIMVAGYGGYLLLAGFDWQDSGIGALIAGVGLYLGLLLGWGKGFAAITGRYNPAEREFWPADYIGDKVYAKTGDAYKAGAAFFTVRAVLFYPLFIGLGLYREDLSGFLLSGTLVFTMGVVYWLAGRLIGESRAVRLAEFAYFTIMGLALA